MLENGLKDKVAIVTGATRGIGFAIAARLLAEGAQVAICSTSQEHVDAAVRNLSQQGNVFGAAADVSRLPDVRQFISAVLQRFGTINILVNNAGAGFFASVADLTPEAWAQTVGLNLTGVYYCSHEVIPIFKQGGGGDVVNIGSLAGANAFAGGAAYNASKFGLNGFSEAMMLDHRYDNVRVSVIMPGSVDTEFGIRPADRGQQQSEKRSEWKIAPEDVADVVACLLRMPRRTMVSRVEIRPSKPPKKK